MGEVVLLRQQLTQASEFLEMTINDVTPQQAHWLPLSKANPLGATYAHLVIGEDVFVNGMLKGTAPLAADSWKGKLGISEEPPPPFPPKSWYEWGRRVQVDLDALRHYSQAVFVATDQHLASLSDADLSRPIDLSSAGFGQQTLAWVISNGVLGHRLGHWGEIACLKGLQGAQGYPA